MMIAHIVCTEVRIPNHQAETVRALKEFITNASYGLLVIGSLSSDDEIAAIQKLSNTLNWPLFADITSGLRTGKELIHSVPYYDLVLSSKKMFPDITPEVVLHFGGKITSKRLQNYLSSNSPDSYIHAQSEQIRYNPSHLRAQNIYCEISQFCEHLMPLNPLQSNTEWLKKWKEASNKCESCVVRTFDHTEDLTEPGVARSLLLNKPNNSPVFLANSMPIRDLDMFSPLLDSETCIYSNRGASGIDGLLATAFGVLYR